MSARPKGPFSPERGLLRSWASSGCSPASSAALPFWSLRLHPLLCGLPLRGQLRALPPPGPPSSPTWRSSPGASSSGGASPTGWGAWGCWCWPRRSSPPWGRRSQYLARAETPGPIVLKLVPRQPRTSKILYGIYCAMTLAGHRPAVGRRACPCTTRRSTPSPSPAPAASPAGTPASPAMLTPAAGGPDRGHGVHPAVFPELRPVLSWPCAAGSEEIWAQRGAALLPGGGRHPGHRAHRLGPGPGLPPGRCWSPCATPSST